MPTSRTVQGRRQINASLLKPFGLAAKRTLAGDQPWHCKAPATLNALATGAP